MICPNCKTEFDGAFCPNCGTAAEKSAESAGNSASGAEVSAKDTAKAKKKHMTVGICAAAAVLIAVVVALVLVLGGNDGRTYFKTPEEAVIAFMEAGSRGDAEAIEGMIYLGEEGSRYRCDACTAEDGAYNKNAPMEKIHALIPVFSDETFEWNLKWSLTTERICTENGLSFEEVISGIEERFGISAGCLEDCWRCYVDYRYLGYDVGYRVPVDGTFDLPLLKFKAGWVIAYPDISIIP